MDGKPRTARRLAAIFAADVVGYSRLMGIDEEGTLAALKTHRKEIIDPLITQHQGRIVKTTGDGLLIEFGSIVDAVRCAVVMQQGIESSNANVDESRRIRFRIGINVGDVIVEGDDIFGDGVNVAARLEALAEPGRICVSATVREHVAEKLPIGFADLGEHVVKNIARPVHVFRIETRREPKTISATDPPPTQLVLPDKPSIAILPFQNMSGDSEQEYFADGMVEDITTALSRFRWLFVIARNSSFTYKGRAVDVKQVGLELGVRYVLEGSVRKAGNRVRITGQLIDAATGAHLWADRFDGDLADIFELQDRITSSVVGTIGPKLEQAEIERSKRKPTESLDAYDYFLRGMAAFHQFTREANTEALEMFTQAFDRDPQFAAAYGMAARCYLQRKGFGWVEDSIREIAEAERLARRAAELGPDDAVALSAAGFTLCIVVGEVSDGSALVDRSLALNPNLAWVWHVSAIAKACLGEPETALEHAAHAMRLSPQDPQISGMHVAIAFAHFIAGRYEEALAEAEAAVRGRINFFVGLCVTAASAALAGKAAQAEKAMSRIREVNPGLSLSNLRALIPFRRDEDFARWAEGLKRAGLPQ
jgi:TolB-like protein/class 3 adenylate cyclase